VLLWHNRLTDFRDRTRGHYSDRCGALQANAPEQLNPRDDEPGTLDDHVERSQGQLLPSQQLPTAAPYKLKVGLDRPEIDVLGIPPRCISGW
jgi:hypothetical protein